MAALIDHVDAVNDSTDNTDITHECNHPTHLKEMIRIHEQYKNTKDELKQLKSIYNKQQQQHDTLIQNYETQITTLNNQHNSLKQQYNTINTQYNDSITQQNNTNNNTQHYISLYTKQIEINTDMAIKIKELEELIITLQQEKDDDNKQIAIIEQQRQDKISNVLHNNNNNYDNNTKYLSARVDSIASEANELITLLQAERVRADKYKDQYYDTQDKYDRLKQQYEQLQQQQEPDIVLYNNDKHDKHNNNDINDAKSLSLQLPHDIELYTSDIIQYSSKDSFNNDIIKEYIQQLNNKWRVYIQYKLQYIKQQHKLHVNTLQRKLDYRHSYSEVINKAKAARLRNQLDKTRQQHMKCKINNNNIAKQYDIDDITMNTIEQLTKENYKLKQQLLQYQSGSNKLLLACDDEQLTINNKQQLIQHINTLINNMADKLWSISNIFCDNIIDNNDNEEAIDQYCNDFFDQLETLVDETQNTIVNL